MFEIREAICGKANIAIFSGVQLKVLAKLFTSLHFLLSYNHKFKGLEYFTSDSKVASNYHIERKLRY